MREVQLSMVHGGFGGALIDGRAMIRNEDAVGEVVSVRDARQNKGAL